MKIRVPTKYLPYIKAAGLFLLLASALLVLYLIGVFSYVPQYVVWMVFVALALISVIAFQQMRFADKARSAFIPDSFLESRELFLELYKQSPVPYLLIDNAGKITYTNTASVRLFGAEEQDLIGKKVFDMLEMPEDSNDDTHYALVESRFKSGVYINDEDMLIRRSDGKTRWVLLSVFTYGQIRKTGLMTLVDVTKQKEIEKAKTEFVSLASHQLHTPISAMKWNLELLSSKRFGNLSDSQSEYVVKVVRSLGRMENIIGDFLHVSQLELGTFSSEPVEFQLSEFIDELIDEHAGRINKKHISVERRYDAGEMTLTTDKRLLQMSVGNLISNASKYTPEKGTVIVHTEHTAKGVSITVSDTGIGIPLEDQEKLFSKFFRAENARKTDTDGTGLGLYIVKLAVETLGGSLSFVSEQGEGTTFVILLPT